MVKLFKEWEGKPCHEYKEVLRPWMEYTSVSAVKKHFTEPFDFEVMSEKCALKPTYRLYGMTAEEIRSEWEKESELGTTHGTMIHATAEEYIRSGFYWRGDTEIQKEFLNWFSKAAEQLDYNSMLVETEMCVHMDICSKDRRWTPKVIMATEGNTLYNAILNTGRVVDKDELDYLLESDTIYNLAKWYLLEVGLAGTMDITEERNHTFIIDDIKTDKKFEHTSFYNPKTREHKWMLYPLQHLHECEAEIYSLQVHIYGILAERSLYPTKKFAGGRIIYVPREHDNFSKAKIIPILERRKEAIAAITAYFFV